MSEAVADSTASEHDVGLYLHIPFCERVCPYCDFAVVPGRLQQEVEARYVAALRKELAHRQRDFEGRTLASVYLGGGTPSLLAPESVETLIGAAVDAFGGAQKRIEVTLEVNPSTVERGRLPGFLAAGVNRLSVGVQSFDDTVLKRLGRAHRAVEASRTLEAARAAGFEDISVDLIFAAPGQSTLSLERDLACVAAFAPEHVSTYELVVEQDTPFALAHARGQLGRATADETADMVERIDLRLGACGILRYELTNYARPGREAVHNRRYWERAPVLGLGMGAWSSDPPGEGAPYGSRRMNARSLATYLQRVEAGAKASDEIEVQDAATARGEAVMLGLRCTAGLAAARFVAWFGAPPRAWFEAEIERLVRDGLLAESPAGDLRLTPQGRMLSDLASQAFVGAS